MAGTAAGHDETGKSIQPETNPNGAFMTRLSYVDAARLSPEQKELYDSIASGPRAAKRSSLVDADGHLTGPFNAFLHNPALGKHWSQIGEALRFRATIDRRLFELAVLIV